MNVKKLSAISLTFLTISFMGILMCVGLLFGEDSEGSSSSGAPPGGCLLYTSPSPRDA